MTDDWKSVCKAMTHAMADERDRTIALTKALDAAEWYVRDHQEAQPNDETATVLELIAAARNNGGTKP